MTELVPMTIDDVIKDFHDTGFILPRASMQWALDHWDEAAPRFVELLSRYADGTDRTQSTADALLFILHLFCKKAETTAFVPLCRMLHDAEATEVAIGDSVTETLRPILITTFNGDVAALRAVIEDPHADEYAREGALLVMAYLTRVGRIPEVETHAYLLYLLTNMLPQDQCHIWVGWVFCVAGLGFVDLAPHVKRLFEREFIDDMFMKYRHFEADLKLTLDDPAGMAGLKQHRLEPFSSAIDELSRWYAFSEQRVLDEKARVEREKARVEREKARAEREAALARQQPSTAGARQQPLSSGAHNPFRDVGRNDPCPCGSGRKFKKCCLGKANELSAA